MPFVPQGKPALQGKRQFQIGNGFVDILAEEAVPQAIEVVGQSEQGGLTLLHRQATSRGAGGEFRLMMEKTVSTLARCR